MARTRDRWLISEAIRKQSLWTRQTHGALTYNGGSYVDLVTDYDERLHVQYGRVGQVVFAEYTHWDRDTGKTVSTETVNQRKRERVLHLIGANNRTHAQSPAL